MKNNLKKLLSVILSLFFLLLAPLNIYSASFSISPTGGYVGQNSEFILDFLIDTDGDETILARSVVTFDPRLVQVVKAERNDSLYCNYPDDEQSVDNNNGVLVLMGFCQSGSDTLYKTVGDAEVYARVTFETIADEGDIDIEWEYSGDDVPFKSVIMEDGSPPQNILSQAPQNISLTIGDGSTSSSTNTSGTVPNTGIGLSIGVIVLGIILVIIGILWPTIRSKFNMDRMGRSGKKGTVVVYE